MSKAFTKDDAVTAEVVVVPHRASLPEGALNYVTPRGLAELRAELVDLAEAHDSRRRELESRIVSAVVVDRHLDPPDDIRFGARVHVRSSEGLDRHYEIVGVDQANPAVGRIAFVAPLARVMLGRRVGDTVTLRTPHGEERLEVLEIAYDRG